MELKKTRKLLIAFFGVIAFITFSSRTIHYYMVPKVTAQMVARGTLEEEHIFFSGIQPYYFSGMAISIDEPLKLPLYVKEIHVDNDQRVLPGQPLITFSTSEYQREIEQKQRQIEDLEMEYAILLNAYNTTIKDLESQETLLNEKIWLMEQGDVREEMDLREMSNNIKRLKDEYEKQQEMVSMARELYDKGAISFLELKEKELNEEKLLTEIKSQEENYNILYNKKLKNYKDELEEVKDKLDFMKETGIVNSRSVFLLSRRLDEAKKEFEALEKYKEDYTLTSATEGIIKDLKVKMNDEYSGMKSLGYIVPQGSELGVKVRLDAEKHQFVKAGMDVSVQTGGITYKGFVYKILQEEDRYMLVRFKENQIIRELKENTVVKLNKEIETSSMTVIIPNSALMDPSLNLVYLLKEKRTFWGREYYVEQTQVRILGSNDKYTAVDAGVLPGDIVVTGWDRELKDGATVRLLAGTGVDSND